MSSEPAAEAVVREIEKRGRRASPRADVSDFPDTFRMAQDVLAEFGHLDILVNNAGINCDKTFVKMDHASWRKVLAINLDGVFNCTKVFVDPMLKQGYGRMVNITSVIGQIGNFGQANYAASKAGVAAFTKSLAKELAGKGITVNAVAPGFIETEMVEAIPDKVRAAPLDQIPLKRFGTAEEVARAVVYLVSSDGDYITGEELSINGGLLMRWAPARGRRARASDRGSLRTRQGGDRGARAGDGRNAWLASGGRSASRRHHLGRQGRRQEARGRGPPRGLGAAYSMRVGDGSTQASPSRMSSPSG